MRVIKKTGLVPVSDLSTGAVYGVAPGKAREMLAAKAAELVAIPSSIETFEAGDLPEPKVAAEIEVDVVVIPDGWETMHHLQKVKLAKTIVGGDLVVPDGQKPLEIAEQVITEEVQRRAAAVPASA